jgi:hypothetical protein
MLTSQRCILTLFCWIGLFADVTLSVSVVSPLPPIALGASAYDSDAAMMGWYLSKSAFCDRAAIVNWSCPTCGNVPGLEHVLLSHNESTGGQGYCGYLPSSNTVIIAFRGSDDIQNWINNLDFFFTDYYNADCTTFAGSNCQVHRGFLNVYDSIKGPLLTQASLLMSTYASRSPSVLVTGHSLGGALTILAAADVSLLFKNATDRIHIYSYGEPRVGNPAWAKWMSESVLVGGKQYRVTHEADPVPRLPPLEFGFLHVPHEVWYNNDLAGNNFTFCVDNATAEDYTNCENTQYAFVPEDHLLYMGIHAGC